MSAPTAEALADILRSLTEAPERGGIFCDVDGTLAPIAERADDAKVPQTTSRLLHRLGRRYGCVACISGRSAADARRLVGVGSITYAGVHGAELLEPGAREGELIPAVASWRDDVRAFAAEHDSSELRRLRVRIEDKGAIMAFHWRGAPDEEAARERLEGLAQQAEEAGLVPHWGRKVLEVRPPVEIGKGQAVRELVQREEVRAGLFAGDDTTDLDGFQALDALVAEGGLDAAVRVGVASDEGPQAIVERADVVAEGVSGFEVVLAALDEP